MVAGHVSQEAYVDGMIASVPEGGSVTIDAHQDNIRFTCNIRPAILRRTARSCKFDCSEFSQGIFFVRIANAEFRAHIGIAIPFQLSWAS